MTDDDRPAFAEAMHLLGETYNEHVSELRAEGYFDGLSDLSLAELNRAVRLALRACRFFPKPVELRELLTGTPDANADAAWGELIREVRRVGYLGTPTFSDERTLLAIGETWGNWAHLCQTLPGEGPELVGWIKQFKSAFQSLERRDVGRQLEPATLHPEPAGFIHRERERIAASGRTNNSNFMHPPSEPSTRELVESSKIMRFRRRVGPEPELPQ